MILTPTIATMFNIPLVEVFNTGIADFSHLPTFSDSKGIT